MTSSPTSSDTRLDGIARPFYEAPFQSTITAGRGWDKNLCEILHSKIPVPYSAYKEITSAYAEILQLLEASNSNLVGLYYRSDLKQMASTAGIFFQYSKWYQDSTPLNCGQLFYIIKYPSMRNGVIDYETDARHQMKTMSSKIETETSLLRDQTGLEQRYRDFDNRRLLHFTSQVSKMLAEISIAIFVCMTILAVVLPQHWKFISSKAVFALAIGGLAYFGFDVSKRMQTFALAVQNLYMHYFLFLWAWNDLKAFLTHIAETDGVSDLKVTRDFVSSFENSFCGKEEELQLVQMRISASPSYSIKKEPGLWQSISGGEPSGRRKIA